MGSSSSSLPLRIIAERAQVSRMTVSLALRNSATISRATRQRVQAIARKLGYRPDPVVSDLMAKLRRHSRTRHDVSIGLVTNQCGASTWRDFPTHCAYRDGAMAQAAELGYNTDEFCLFADGMTERRLGSIMYSRGIDIAILFPLINREPGYAIKLDWDKFAFATYGYSLARPILHRSCFAHMRAVMEAYRQVTALGYAAPALVLDANQDRRVSHGWTAGFLAASHLARARRSNLLYNPETLTRTEFIRWFRRCRPDVILHVGAEDQLPDWLAQSGAKVPDDVGHVHLDLAPGMVGRTSGIDQQSFQVGASGVDLAVSALRVSERGIPAHPKIVLIDGVWCPGATTRNQA